MPNIHVDPRERIAIMRKGSAIRIAGKFLSVFITIVAYHHKAYAIYDDACILY